MTTKPRILHYFASLLFVLAFVWSFWFFNNDPEIYASRQRLEDYRQRYLVCFDYESANGDYAWRHNYCQNAGKEYMEVFREIYPEPKETNENS